MGPAPSAWECTVTLAHGKPVFIEEESLTLSLQEVKDGRCPREVRCIWAGHAAVTLQVDKAGWAAEMLRIGTPAPAHMKLPFQAQYGSYRLHLLGLEPGRSITTPTALPQYQATITIATERR